jgi:hypothetical protein
MRFGTKSITRRRWSRTEWELYMKSEDYAIK